MRSRCSAILAEGSAGLDQDAGEFHGGIGGPRLGFGFDFLRLALFQLGLGVPDAGLVTCDIGFPFGNVDDRKKISFLHLGTDVHGQFLELTEHLGIQGGIGIRLDRSRL